MEKTKTIFSVMKRLHYDILVHGYLGETTFSEQTKKYFQYFETYFKSGMLGKSERVKFILSNYGQRKETIAEVWNMSHEKKLNTNAIYIQESRINKVFTEVFGQPSDIEVAFLSEDFTQMSLLIDKIRILKQGDTSIDTFFTKDILNELLRDSMDYSAFDYQVEDCKAELDFLVKISNLNIKKIAAQSHLDKNKLAFLIGILNQSLLTNNYTINKKKYELVRLLHKGFSATDSDESLEGVIETRDFLAKQEQQAHTNDTNFEEMYYQLLEKYKELENKVSLTEQQTENATSDIVSPLFDCDITIPSSIMALLEDVATSYEGDKVLALSEAKEFSDTLYAITKYATPIISLDIVGLDDKMLYCLWAALNNKLEVEGMTQEGVADMINGLRAEVDQRVGLLCDSDYISKVQKVLKSIANKKQKIQED